MINDLAPIPADDGFQRIGWRGFLLIVPDSWNLRLFDGNDRQGALFFADLRATRLEFRWRSPPLIARISRADPRALLKKNARRLRSKAGAHLTELPEGALRAEIAGATFLLAAVGPRLCELHWPVASGEPDARVRDRIAADFLNHATPLQPERFWSVYGAEGWLPKNVRLQKTSLLPGETRLVFTERNHTITLAATSLADRLLAARGSLRLWAQTLPEMQNLPPGVWHESASAASFTVNHPGFFRRTAHRLEFRHDAVSNRITWSHHAPEFPLELSEARSQKTENKRHQTNQKSKMKNQKSQGAAMTTAPPPVPGCIFCKIAAGEIPCFKIFEDEAVLAFLDVNPTVTGHTLVIPKAHFPNVMETPPEVMAALSRQLPAVARAVLAATGTTACHVLLNNGAEAMQTISHLHYHIMPRKVGDGFGIPWKTSPLEKTAANTLLATIQKNLASAESE